MSNPVTVRQREEAIRRRRAREQQTSREFPTQVGHNVIVIYGISFHMLKFQLLWIEIRFAYRESCFMK